MEGNLEHGRPAGSLIRVISENDAMRDGVKPANYFIAGQSALDAINLCLAAASKPPDSVASILDLPCGHGRVLRHLKLAFPRASITACDIDRDGVDFCAEALGALPVYSRDDPAEIPIPRDSFDLIWVGSLFTHLDADRWPGFLEVLRSSLRPAGLLVFTTHGRDAHRRMIAESFDFGLGGRETIAVRYGYERRGFGYTRYPGSSGYYGVSLSHVAHVARQVERVEGLELRLFLDRGWAAFQDVYGCVRVEGPGPAEGGISLAGLVSASLGHRLQALKNSLRTRTRLRAMSGPKTTGRGRRAGP